MRCGSIFGSDPKGTEGAGCDDVAVPAFAAGCAAGAPGCAVPFAGAGGPAGASARLQANDVSSTAAVAARMSGRRLCIVRCSNEPEAHILLFYSLGSFGTWQEGRRQEGRRQEGRRQEAESRSWELG